jgi:hypothetical protein
VRENLTDEQTIPFLLPTRLSKGKKIEEMSLFLVFFLLLLSSRKEFILRFVDSAEKPPSLLFT